MAVCSFLVSNQRPISVFTSSCDALSPLYRDHFQLDTRVIQRSTRWQIMSGGKLILGRQSNTLKEVLDRSTLHKIGGIGFQSSWALDTGLAYLKGDCVFEIQRYERLDEFAGQGGATHFEPCISPLASVRPPTELCVACSSEIREQSSSHAMPKTPPFSLHPPMIIRQSHWVASMAG
jgi:hypothetical protein